MWHQLIAKDVLHSVHKFERIISCQVADVDRPMPRGLHTTSVIYLPAELRPIAGGKRTVGWQTDTPLTSARPFVEQLQFRYMEKTKSWDDASNVWLGCLAKAGRIVLKGK